MASETTAADVKAVKGYLDDLLKTADEGGCPEQQTFLKKKNHKFTLYENQNDREEQREWRDKDEE